MNKKPIKLINLAALSKSRLNLDIKNSKRDFATKLSSLTLLKIAPIFHICRQLCVKNFTKRLFHQKIRLKKRAKKIPRCVNIWAGGKGYCGHPVASGFLFFIFFNLTTF